MKRRWLASLICFLMLSSVLLFSACSVLNGEAPENSDTQNMIDNYGKVDYEAFTYTYYNADGRNVLGPALINSAFNEAYVFVDPGSEGTYYDKKTNATLTFVQLLEKEVGLLSADLAYRLIATYSDTNSEIFYKKQDLYTIIEQEMVHFDSTYKVQYAMEDALGADLDSDTLFTDAVIDATTPARYYVEDEYFLSLLAGLNNIDESGVTQTNKDNFKNILKKYFVLNQDASALSVNAIAGAGFGTTINKSLNIENPTSVANTDHDWVVMDTIGEYNPDTIESKLAEVLYDLIIDVKSGNTSIENIDHLGFTEDEKALLKEKLIAEIIGEDNYNYDMACLDNIIKNSSDIDSEKGKYVTINADNRINGNVSFETLFSQIKERLVTAGSPEDVDYVNYYNQFMNEPDVVNYLKMFDYKAYDIGLDAIVKNVFLSPQYNNEILVPNTGENSENLYQLFPRVQVYIVPGMYLGGEYDESMEEDLGEEPEDYDFDEIADKSDFNVDEEPKKTMEPYLPPWKILSVVYKPGNVYGINRVTEERIDGIIVPDIDIAFVGEEGYTSVIESTITYVTDGNVVIPAGEKFLSTELIDDVCPDMTAEDYPDEHYMKLFELTETTGDDLDKYILKEYDGVDLKVLAAENEKIRIGKVSTTGGKVYYEKVDGLPVDENFLTLTESQSGNIIDMPGLGNYYLKLDINFNKIADVNGNNITASQKRTNLGVISIEPHTAS